MRDHPRVSPSSLQKWMLDTPQLLAALRRWQLQPWLGSPLARLESAGRAQGRSAPVDGDPQLRDALANLAQPEMIVGAVYSPPAEPSVAWYYARNGDRRLALYHRRPDGLHRLAWPVAKETLLELTAGPMVLHRPATDVGFSVTLDYDSFAALVAIVDVTLEVGERAAAQNQAPPVPRFDAGGLLAAAERNLRRIDSRWMAQRALLISPTRFAPTMESLTCGLQALAAQGLLDSQRPARRSAAANGGIIFTPTRRLHDICSLLTETNGFCALVTHRRVRRRNGTFGWGREHVAGLRARRSIWLLEFTGISRDGFTADLTDVGADAMGFRLAAGIYSPGDTNAPAAVAPTDARRCPECGAQPRPEATFCDQCGARLTSPQRRPATPPTCAQCGTRLHAGSRFCTDCGAPAVDERERPAGRPAATRTAATRPACSACGGRLKVGKRFCTTCGTPVQTGAQNG